jgi:hypothetical protein
MLKESDSLFELNVMFSLTNPKSWFNKGLVERNSSDLRLIIELIIGESGAA